MNRINNTVSPFRRALPVGRYGCLGICGCKRLLVFQAAVSVWGDLLQFRSSVAARLSFLSSRAFFGRCSHVTFRRFVSCFRAIAR